MEALFERIERETGRLDLVVGNAWGGYADHDWRTFGAPLWEQPLSRWQTMFDSGLRNQLTTARHAAGRMVEQGSGLIVFTGGWDDPGEYLGNLYYDVEQGSGLAARLRTGPRATQPRRRGHRNRARLHADRGRPRRLRRPREWIRQRRRTRRSTSAVRSSRSPPTRRRRLLTGTSVQVATLGERYGFADVDGRTFAEFRMPAENRLAWSNFARTISAGSAAASPARRKAAAPAPAECTLRTPTTSRIPLHAKAK